MRYFVIIRVIVNKLKFDNNLHNAKKISPHLPSNAAVLFILINAICHSFDILEHDHIASLFAELDHQ